MSKVKNLSAIGLMLLLIFGAYRLIERKPQTVAEAPHHRPDWVVHDLTTTQHDVNGEVKYQVKAKKWHQFQDQNHAQITSPEITIYDENRHPWFLRAHWGEVGRTSLNNPAVKLWEKVVVYQAPTPKQDQIVASTQELLIYPASHYAETEAPITLLQKKNIIKSTGMQIFLNEKKILFLNDVRSYYAST